MIDFRRFPGRRWPLVLFGFICVFWGNFGQSFFVGVYGESFKSTLQLNASQYGAVYSLATFAAGFIFLFAGVWIDRIPLRQFALVAGVGLASACLVLAWSNSVFLLFIGLFLVRLFGQSLLPHTGMITMARSFHRDRGKALGAAASAVPLGEIVLPLLAIVLIARVGASSSWLIFAIAVFVLYFPLVLFLLKKDWLDSAEESETEHGDTAEISGRFALLKTRRFWFVLPALLFGPFVVTGIFIHQDYVLQVKAWAGALWASAFVLYGIVHWVASFIVGVLIDRYSAQHLLPWYNLPTLLALLVLLFVAPAYSVLLFLGLLGFAIGFGGPIGAALWAELYGKKHLGGIRSMVAAFTVVATAISPILFGLAIDMSLTFTSIVYSTLVLGVSVCLLAALAFRKS